MSERLSSIQVRERSEKPGEECGVFGMYFPHPDFRNKIATALFTGIHYNQHRGEEAAGVVVADGERISPVFKRQGLIYYVHKEFNSLDTASKSQFEGFIGVAHNRYSTTGSNKEINAGPFRHESPELGPLAVSHNGNITNAAALKVELMEQGAKFKSTTDSEIIGELIVRSEGQMWEEKIASALRQLEGSFSLVMLTRDALYAARDTLGNRPLSYAEFEKDNVAGYAVSSETPALESLGVKYHQEVRPGELIRFDEEGIHSMQYLESELEAFCGFEIAYAMRPDARVNGRQLDSIRRNLGARLAQLHSAPETVDYVIGIPESAKSSAEGYGEELSRILGRPIPVRTGMLKGRYPTIDGAVRGFMNPDHEVRSKVATDNYFPFDWIAGKEIVVVDDSIVRGITTEGVIFTLREKVGILRNSGSSKIHLRIIFPQIIGPCPLGTDINEQDRLISRDLVTLEAVARALGVDSLGFHTPETYTQGVREAIGRDIRLCLGCTTLDYPVKNFSANKQILELTSQHS